MSDHPFVLLHGAFRGGWAWDRVRPFLTEANHQVYTPDLTDPGATLTSIIDDVAMVFATHNIYDAVLVGHSQGGFFARAASQLLAGRIATLAFIDAPVPAHGQCAFDFQSSGAPAPTVERGDCVDPFPVAPSAGLSAVDAAWINERLVPQAVAPSLDQVTLDDPSALALPVEYLFFGQTPEGFPCAATRAKLDREGTAYEVIDAPHDGIVTHPRQVANWLLRL